MSILTHFLVKKKEKIFEKFHQINVGRKRLKVKATITVGEKIIKTCGS